MTKLNDTIDSGAQHICIFGEPYTGKSTLAASVAELGFKVLWFSFDKGYTVLRKLNPAARELVELVRIPDTKDAPTAIKTMLKVITGASIAICDQHGVVDCRSCKASDSSLWTNVYLNNLKLDTIVVFDHITQVADSAMQYVIQRAIASNEKDATGTTEKDPDFFKPGFDQYRGQGFLMTKILTNIQAANYHSITIAHVAEVEQEDGRKKLVPLIGSVPYSRNSPKYFDHLICCELFNKQHRFGSITTYSASLVSGSRTDVDIGKEGVPSLRKFFEGSIEKIGSYGEEVAREVVNSIPRPTLSREVVEANSTVGAVQIPSATLSTAATSNNDTAEKMKQMLRSLKR